MAKKKTISPVQVATAIIVECPVNERRCRAGRVFKKGEATRIEIDQLAPEEIAAIEADPLLKVSFETEEDPEAVNAEARILELEGQLADKDAEITELKAYKVQADKLLSDYQVQLAEFTEAVVSKDAEIAELKAAATTKPKK